MGDIVCEVRGQALIGALTLHHEPEMVAELGLWAPDASTRPDPAAIFVVTTMATASSWMGSLSGWNRHLPA